MKRIALLLLISTLTSLAAAQSLPEIMKVDLGGGMTLDMVLIKPGTFTMGSDKAPEEKPAHQVTIAKPFYIGKYLVTQEQWKNVMGSNPSKFKGYRVSTASVIVFHKNPVDQVSWTSATNFIAKLSEKHPGQQFSLPTEAQWEYACRAGSTTDYCYGDDKTALRDYAIYYVNAQRSTQQVGEKKPNAWGLYDVHGNVWEWCLDPYHKTYEGAPADGTAWTTGGEPTYVLRGGAWHNSEINLRSATRGTAAPTPYAANDAAFGLRIVMTPP